LNLIKSKPDLLHPDFTKLWEHLVFVDLAPNQVEWLSGRLAHENIPARSTIYSSSDEANHFYFIFEGKVKLEVCPPEDGCLIKRICYKNEFFGFKGLFEKQLFNEYARTLRTSVSVIKFPTHDVRRLCEVNQQFTLKLMSLIGEEVHFYEKRTYAVSELSARARFARFLMDMTQKEGSFDGTEWFFNSQLTQAEIGAYIGTGRQTVTEILNDFKEQGIIRYTWGKFFIQQIDSLKGYLSL